MRTHRPPSRARVARRRGFTLVEAVLAAGAMALLMGATVSVIAMAARSVPSAAARPERAMAASNALERLADDFSAATAVKALTASTIAFYVADRTGDGVQDLITYAYSAGTLTRTLNAETPVVLLDRLASLDIAAALRTVSTTTTSPTPAGAEQVVAGNDPGNPPGAAAVTSLASFGQKFRPTLPTGATHWQPTRVLFRAALGGTNAGSMRVMIDTLDLLGAPVLPAVVETTFAEKRLSNSQELHEVIFQNAPAIAVGDSCAVLFVWSSDLQAARLGVASGSPPSGQQYITAPALNLVWVSAGSGSLCFQVLGRPVRPAGTTSVKYLDSIRLRLSHSTDAPPTEAALRPAAALDVTALFP
jgi:Tfp pilus assembly protein PilV